MKFCKYGPDNYSVKFHIVKLYFIIFNQDR